MLRKIGIIRPLILVSSAEALVIWDDGCLGNRMKLVRRGLWDAARLMRISGSILVDLILHYDVLKWKHLRVRFLPGRPVWPIKPAVLQTIGSITFYLGDLVFELHVLEGTLLTIMLVWWLLRYDRLAVIVIEHRLGAYSQLDGLGGNDSRLPTTHCAQNIKILSQKIHELHRQLFGQFFLVNTRVIKLLKNLNIK